MKSKIILLISAIWLGYLSTASAILQWPMTVTNIAELQSLHLADVIGAETAYTTSVSPAVYVLGYYTPGDRGGGMFEWNPNSSGTPDGGRYFPTNGWTSGNGRWVRRFAGEAVNVRMWGAKGDINGGVETPSNIAAATDDTTAIQNALNVINDTGDASGWSPTELLFPAGFYKVTSTLIWSPLVKLRGEGARMAHIVMPYGTNQDILHSLAADEALHGTNSSNLGDAYVRIDDLSFDFATQSGNSSTESGHNTTNSGIVIIWPLEGTEIRNVSVESGGIGIRCFGGGGGAVAAFRDIVCSDSAIAGISIEPPPDRTSCAGQVSITGITGDHRWDESRSNACLVRFLNYDGPALVEDINAEAAYGGGVIQSQYPAADVSSQMGTISIRNGALNSGTSFSGYDCKHDFVVLKDGGGQRTVPIIMENIQDYGTNLIRDELTGRLIQGIDADGQGPNQAVCRVPIQYESYNPHSNRGDGTPVIFSRLIAGGQTLYSFVPPTNGWYRIICPMCYAGMRAGGKITVTSQIESSAFDFDLDTTGGLTDSALITVDRASHDGTYVHPCVTQVRAGTYTAPDTYNYGFVDIDVEHILPPYNGEPMWQYVTVSYPAYDIENITATGGGTPLLIPTAPLASIVPSGSTLRMCVTNSLIR